MTGSNEQILRN